MLEFFRVSTDDVPLLAQMLALCFADTYLPENINPANETPAEIFHSLKNRDFFAFIATENAEAVGVVRMKMTGDTARIIDFSVVPDARFRGVGTRMLSKLMNLYDEVNFWYAESVAQDEEFMNFWLKNKFVETDNCRDIDEDLYFVELEYKK